MSLLYRAIWQDDASATLDVARGHFNEWLSQRTGDTVSLEGPLATRVNVPDTFSSAGYPIPAYVAELNCESVFGKKVSAGCSARLIESRRDGSRWDTTLRTWRSVDDGATWVWVDVEAVGPIELSNLAVAAPRFVVELLKQSPRARHGDVPVSARPRYFNGRVAGELLAEEISDPNRELPIVTFSFSEMRTRALLPEGLSFVSLVTNVAVQIAGVASVVVADPEASRSLTDALGRSHGVWGGALRCYLPGLDPAIHGDAWRHRLLLPERFLAQRDSAPTFVSRMLGPISGLRRPPASYNDFKSLLSDRATSAEEYKELLSIADDELEELKRQAGESEERYNEVVSDLEDATEMQSMLQARVDALQEAIRVIGAEGSGAHAAFPMDAPAVPTSASSLSDALAKASEFLTTRLTIHPEAPRDLDDLDATVTAGSWGQTAWRGFRALHAYASAMNEKTFQGNFWAWCSDSGGEFWPATSKKLAMSESETVESSPKLRNARILPVSTSVEESGKMYMPAHLKIATGGGDLAPRIYFHFDPTSSVVHVGFFGPHKYMPNTRT